MNAKQTTQFSIVIDKWLSPSARGVSVIQLKGRLREIASYNRPDFVSEASITAASFHS